MNQRRAGNGLYQLAGDTGMDLGKAAAPGGLVCKIQPRSAQLDRNDSGGMYRSETDRILYGRLPSGRIFARYGTYPEENKRTAERKIAVHGDLLCVSVYHVGSVSSARRDARGREKSPCDDGGEVSFGDGFPQKK